MIHEQPDSAADTPCGWTLGQLARLSATHSWEIGWRERDAYDFGYADGYAAGARAAETEMAEHWAALSRTVRARANRLKGTVPEPAVRPRHDDSIWFAPGELDALLDAADRHGRPA